MKAHHILLLYILFLASCHSTKNDLKNVKSDSSSQHDAVPNTVNTLQTSGRRIAYSEIIRIDYQKNKQILDILPLLPDSTMASWIWKKEEREGMVNNLKANNQFTDTTENYNTISKVTPNYFETGVVDGFWTASIYTVSENHQIIVTNDVVGDGYDIKAFELKDGKLKALNVDSLIGTKPGNLLLKHDTEKCKAEISEEEAGMFSYDLSDPSLLRISCYISEKEHGDCFKGNELTLKFNPLKKRFDFEKIDWKKFQ